MCPVISTIWHFPDASLSLLVQEVNEYFKEAELSLKDSNEKIDDHLLPLEPAVCGSVARSSEELLKKYENIGKHFCHVDLV